MGLEYGFMRNAFVAILIITPLFGMLGTMIVSRKMAFFSDALGHSALTGIAFGVILGVADTNITMVVFGIAFALLLNYISSKSGTSTDTIISVFSSCSVAIGLAILSKGGNFSPYIGQARAERDTASKRYVEAQAKADSLSVASEMWHNMARRK